MVNALAAPAETTSPAIIEPGNQPNVSGGGWFDRQSGPERTKVEGLAEGDPIGGDVELADDG